jgi:hypothetical protein
MVECINTHKLVNSCDQKECMHYHASAHDNCLQFMYGEVSSFSADSPELLQSSGLEDQSSAVIKRMLKSAESKMVVWGRVLERLNDLKSVDFISFVTNLHSYDDGLVEGICNDLDCFIIPPMRFVRTEKWCSIVNEYAESLLESGLASDKNKHTWDKVKMYWSL